MGRLIDADELLKQPIDTAHYPSNFVKHAPTVEAIPKADYEARLKADMVAMLTELKNELTDISWNIDMYDDDLDFECCYLSDIDKVIRQKIDKLTRGEDGNDD